MSKTARRDPLADLTKFSAGRRSTRCTVCRLPDIDGMAGRELVERAYRDQRIPATRISEWLRTKDISITKHNIYEHFNAGHDKVTDGEVKI